MNLLRDQAILELNRRNVKVLTEQLKQTKDRFNVGEVTRTDVAQAEIAACRRARPVAQRAVECGDLGGDLPARHRRRSGQAGAGQPGRPVLAQLAAEGDHRRRAAQPDGAGGDVRRRRRRARRQGQRRRALSQSLGGGDGVEELRSDRGHQQADIGFDHRHADGSALSGRRRVLHHPAIERDARPAAPQSRRQPRPGPRHSGAELGPARRRQGRDRVRPRRR